MKRSTLLYGVFGAVILALMVTGCYIISGTFVIIKKFSFTSETGFYHEMVDVTNEADWKNHKDEIDDIDLVGFELWFTNNETFDVTFNAYVDGPGAPEYTTFAEVDANADKVLDNLILPAGPGTRTHVTYGNSFKFIESVDKLKKAVLNGKFHFYGVSSGGTATGFVVDSAVVIVTFSAHGS
jgi:hypothetical protein